MPANKRVTGLGKGFDALIPQNFDSSLLLGEEERIHKLPVSQLASDPNQPRKHFDEESINELARSIKQHGVLLPLVVVTAGKDSYQIVAGERRWRAARIAKVHSVPAIVKTLQEIERLEVALIENVQRVDLSPLEQAVSIAKLHEQFNVSYEEIAKRLGKAMSTVSNIARLLSLPEEAKQDLRELKISEGHARAVLALKDYPPQQRHLLAEIKKHGWSVRQAETYVNSVKSGAKDKKTAHARVTTTETPATKSLGKKLAAEVKIRRTAKGGKLEIGFDSDEDLERILKKLA